MNIHRSLFSHFRGKLIFSILLLFLLCVSCQDYEGIGQTPASTSTSETGESISTPAPQPTTIANILESKVFPIDPMLHVLYPAMTLDGKWVVIPGGYFPTEGEKIHHNIWVKDLQVDSSDWTPLFSREEAEDEELYNIMFSPDGKYLAAVTLDTIWFFSTNDWQQRVKYEYQVFNWIFDWCPDSSGIAVQIIEGDYVLYYLQLDGTKKPLIRIDEAFQYGYPQGELRNVYDWGPAWSPDGKTIAYAKFTYDDRLPFDSSTYQELWILDIASDTKTKLLTLGLGSLDWSPDGQKISFESHGINILDINSKTVHVLSQNYLDNNAINSMSSDYTWSPDSRQIAFYTNSYFIKKEGVFIADVDSGKIELIKQGYYDPFAWSIDNNILVFNPNENIFDLIQIEAK